MRLRNIKGAKEQIAASPYVIQNPVEHKGSWNKFFQNDNPIHIEIGMGKGKFIHELAQMHPEINYIGIERYQSVLIRALSKRAEFEGDNLFFLCEDARNLTEYFDDSEVARIYLNFSDPWPKDRHAKRRLTSSGFLSIYNEILASDGRLEFKTDNISLFDFSLEELPASGWNLDYVNRNIHENGPATDNVMTEYEEKFYGLGNPIQKLIATR